MNVRDSLLDLKVGSQMRKNVRIPSTVFSLLKHCYGKNFTEFFSLLYEKYPVSVVHNMLQPLVCVTFVCTRLLSPQSWCPDLTIYGPFVNLGHAIRTLTISWAIISYISQTNPHSKPFEVFSFKYILSFALKSFTREISYVLRTQL